MERPRDSMSITVFPVTILPCQTMVLGPVWTVSSQSCAGVPCPMRKTVTVVKSSPFFTKRTSLSSLIPIVTFLLPLLGASRVHTCLTPFPQVLDHLLPSCTGAVGDWLGAGEPEAPTALVGLSLSSLRSRVVTVAVPATRTSAATTRVTMRAARFLRVGAGPEASDSEGLACGAAYCPVAGG